MSTSQAYFVHQKLWNRTDEPLNPSKSRAEYSSRLFPCWIFVSEFPFKDLEGKEGCVCTLVWLL